MATCTVRCKCGNTYALEVKGKRNYTTKIRNCFICRPTTNKVTKIKNEKPHGINWDELLN